jgi:demethylmenaquinone methyltransferase/2-methoxy-6-polyprenyl-1,4-benzoquinol methylase
VPGNDGVQGRIELVRGDALQYVFPSGVDGIISTYALSLVPECDEVICKGAQALPSAGALLCWI